MGGNTKQQIGNKYFSWCFPRPTVFFENIGYPQLKNFIMGRVFNFVFFRRQITGRDEQHDRDGHHYHRSECGASNSIEFFSTVLPTCVCGVW